MPYLTPSQIERMKKNAADDAMREVLSMERTRDGRHFVYSDDIRKFIRSRSGKRRV